MNVPQTREKTLTFPSAPQTLTHASQMHTRLPKATSLHGTGQGRGVEPLGSLASAPGHWAAGWPRLLQEGAGERVGAGPSWPQVRDSTAVRPGSLSSLCCSVLPGSRVPLSRMGGPRLLIPSSRLRFGGRFGKGRPRPGLGCRLLPALRRARSPAPEALLPPGTRPRVAGGGLLLGSLPGLLESVVLQWR